jgi:UBA/TS-N domain
VEKIANLVNMGFDKTKVEQALVSKNWDPNQALDALL